MAQPSLAAYPLILSFSPWKKEPSNCPQRIFWRPLSHGERVRVRGDSLSSSPQTSKLADTPLTHLSSLARGRLSTSSPSTR